MPLAQITIIEGRTKEQKELLIKNVTDAIVESIDAPIEAVRVLIQEIPGEHWGIAGKPKISSN